ncbi:hypothetical protein [Streptomyces sp. NPDC046859]|uniref:hypothetical protein n=1 Tax=Streptomyces sp. NPDC046859 TaxID=3155734 RepID=UPI0033E762FE
MLDVEIVDSLRFGPPVGRTDLEVAVALTRLLYDDFVSHGTNGQGRRLDDETVPVVMKAHRTVLEGLALKPPVWPFRTFDGPRGFGSHRVGRFLGSMSMSSGVTHGPAGGLCDIP